MATSGPPRFLEQTPLHHEQQDYSDDGVDLTLIHWMLSLTPTERLQILQQSVESLSRLTREACST
ncbi:MAG TPA: hypothetical protein DEO88_13080 [Syntrophobacteraceae bacterium]|nr:hypothetical protein [Syntrophobacteraceae bacterium]